MKYSIDSFTTTDPMVAEVYRTLHGGHLRMKSKSFVTLPLSEGLELINIVGGNALYSIYKDTDYYDGGVFRTESQMLYSSVAFENVVDFILHTISNGIAVVPSLDFYADKVRLPIRGHGGSKVSYAYTIRKI